MFHSLSVSEEVTAMYAALTESEYERIVAEWFRFAKQRKNREEKERNGREDEEDE